MNGADMLIVQFDSLTGALSAADYFAPAKAYPSLDSCQHWQTLYANNANNLTQVVVSRPLQTNDTQDRDILATVGYATKIVWALGSSPSLGYHGANRLASFLYLNGTSAAVASSDPNMTNITVAISNFTIPNDTTVYACQSFVMPQDLQYYIKKFSMIFSNTVVKVQVHHLLLHACQNISGGYFQKYLNNPGVCGSPVGKVGAYCDEIVYGWAPGGGDFSLPDDVAFPMGIQGVQFLLIEMHYNNPYAASGEFDSSGVNVFYTTTPSTHSAAVLTASDPFTQSADIPAGVAQTHYEYTCPYGCTSQFAFPMYVFADLLHMHSYGSEMWSIVTRASTGEQKQIHRIEYYDFGFQPLYQLNETIYPGDQINTHCVYDTSSSSTAVEFGVASTQEMCIQFIWYYPKQDNISYCGYLPFSYYGLNNDTVCGMNYTQDVGVVNPASTNNPSLIERTVGSAPQTCPAGTLSTTASPTISPSSSPTAAAVTSSPTMRASHSTKLGVGTAVGIAVIVLAFAGGVAMVLYRRRRTQAVTFEQANLLSPAQDSGHVRLGSTEKNQ
eukprot:TRINITY_DN19879_c0_g1_i5.p1 TRINITY_DN19879_c0_g1~~TRINITY_DN19879_c0_g1_i5.p1  ORF type:complete len:640 (+),score=127.00 TRINITY_DN19879_c0_g1_i5:256-1920(+)